MMTNTSIATLIYLHFRLGGNKYCFIIIVIGRVINDVIVRAIIVRIIDDVVTDVIVLLFYCNCNGQSN